MLQLLPIVLFGFASTKNRESARSRRVFPSSNGASFTIFAHQALGEVQLDLCLSHMNRNKYVICSQGVDRDLVILRSFVLVSLLVQS